MTTFARSDFGSQRAIILGLESSRGLWVHIAYVRWAKALLMGQDLGLQDTRTERREFGSRTRWALSPQLSPGVAVVLVHSAAKLNHAQALA